MAVAVDVRRRHRVRKITGCVGGLGPERARAGPQQHRHLVVETVRHDDIEVAVAVHVYRRHGGSRAPGVMLVTARSVASVKSSVSPLWRAAPAGSGLVAETLVTAIVTGVVTTVVDASGTAESVPSLTAMVKVVVSVAPGATWFGTNT